MMTALLPWLEVNGRRIGIPVDAVPPHLSPCRKCGRLLPDADPYDTCGACFGSVGPTDEIVTEQDIEDDPREEPCPECPTGEVVSAGPMELETGHHPYTCDQACGFHG